MRLTPTADDLLAIWRLLLVRATIVFVLSVAALPWPVLSIATMLILVSSMAVASGLFDAAISGALQRRLAGGWALLPEAVIGVLLGIGVLIYPLAPISVVAILTALWMIARGIVLVSVARGAASDAMVRVLAAGWAAASILGPVFMIVHRDELALVPVLELLVAYALVWSALEVWVGLHLRSRGRVRERDTTIR